MSLFKPDNFARDWYGELTNQEGHTLVGMRIAFAFCIVWLLVDGELPNRFLALSLVGVPYLAFEMAVQKSVRRGLFGDALVDTYMVLCGAALLLLPFREISVVSIFEIHLAFNPVAAGGIWLLRDSVAFKRVWKRR